MDITPYLDRVGVSGPLRTDEDTLIRLHEAHLRTFPYENLDIQLGQRKSMDPERWQRRLVDEHRGGWCYEMNGLFSCVLREIGFRVDRLGGGVYRDRLGDESVGNHMVLLVDLERPMIADVGLGDGPFHPFPLEARRWSEGAFAFGLERADGSWWRFHNHEHGLAKNFDFQEKPWALEDYAPTSAQLQDGEESVFRALAMTFRRDPERIRGLRDLTAIVIENGTLAERRIETLEDYAATLTPLIDFELGDDLPRLYTQVRHRVAERKRLEEALASDA
ncbi:MAG: arylamine N-acetyltransferase [bacterium]|nr:arylamine N-acetyltransferase [bacterium]